jgi:hypothetical protein
LVREQRAEQLRLGSGSGMSARGGIGGVGGSSVGAQAHLQQRQRLADRAELLGSRGASEVREQQ